MMDANNKLLNHIIVALASFLMVYGFWLSGIDLNRSVAGVSFILLFLTLIIGPLMKLWRPALQMLPWNLPWSWRGELGIWFALLSIVHTWLIFNERQWQMGLRLSDLLGVVALFLALILTATSLGRVIRFLGVESWRWLHSFTYVIFYLVSAHVINHAFMRAGRPADWLHWVYLILIVIIIGLQFTAFINSVVYYRKNLKNNNI